MTNPTDQPLTMDAEWEQWAREHLPVTAGAIFRELDAERAAHAETREQLRVLEDELHRLRDIAIPKFQIHRERLEEQLAEAQTLIGKFREVINGIGQAIVVSSHPKFEPLVKIIESKLTPQDLGYDDDLAALRAKPEPEASASSEESSLDARGQKLERLHPQCAHVDFEPVRFGALTGVMIGGASQCHRNAEPGLRFCAEHWRKPENDKPTSPSDSPEATAADGREGRKP